MPRNSTARRHQPFQAPTFPAQPDEQIRDEFGLDRDAVGEFVGREDDHLWTARQVCARLQISERRWRQLKRAGLAPQAHPVLKDRWVPDVVTAWMRGRGCHRSQCGRSAA